MVLQWEMDLQRRRRAVDVDENCRRRKKAFRFQSPSEKQTAEIIKKSNLQTWKVPFSFEY